ncbi:MAG: stage II sporulation protein R [Thermacetogeniaceae bacterium]|jgi:stage II sporulation protein R|nr:stage II sporulation protein R [Thermoanaerobacterales bacterium]NLN22138.1 stage II sporulation protein R [Syntrophomonadaceae bacterium]HAF17377.1 stage II sporulation protein R [Peptococcaceae bacterium]
MAQQKIGILLLLCSLLTLVFIGTAVQTKTAYTTDNLIRLHVIANSDHQQDQAIKYKVRDRIIEIMKEQLTGVQNYQEAREVIINNRSQLTAAVEEVIAASGLTYPVSLEYGRFDFPSRAYGKLVLPQGEYEAVKVVLGNGKGANWWCVLFPPLCFVDISGDALEMEMINEENTTMEVMAQQEENMAVTKIADENRVDLNFKVLEWLNRDNGYLAKLKGLR